MISRIPFESLGSANYGWLHARYHFSFSRYYDPARMGYPPLLVWNDDTIQAHTGFDLHPHDNMEIITYIRKGAITHKDSQGNQGRTVAGDVQVMSAGTGIYHSEFNEEDEPTVLFQIWIQTASRNVAPSWETREFPRHTDNQLVPFVSGRQIHAHLDLLPIHQDAAIHVGVLEAGSRYTFKLEPDRHAYLVSSTGKFRINGMEMNARDGAHVSKESELVFEVSETAEIVLADLPLV